jgi:hypothetical protein
VATKASNDTDQRLASREVVIEFPTGVVDLSKRRQIVRLVRIPRIDVLHLGSTGAPEGHPNNHARTKTKFGSAVL